MDVTLFSFSTLAEFNRIADHQVIRLIENVSEEEYHKDFGSTLGNIHKKCAHIAGWVDFFVHFLDDALDTREKTPDLTSLSREELISKWQTDQDRLVELIKVKQGTHDVTLPGGNQTSMDLGHIYFDAVDHASYHRGQIMTYLRLLGRPTVNTDYLTWWFETQKKE